MSRRRFTKQLHGAPRYSSSCARIFVFAVALVLTERWRSLGSPDAVFINPVVSGHRSVKLMGDRAWRAQRLICRAQALNSLTVAALKNLLRVRSLPVSGTKAVLIARLQQTGDDHLTAATAEDDDASVASSASTSAGIPLGSEDWQSMKVDELKVRLRALGLPLAGRKAQLITRLESALSVATPDLAPQDGAATRLASFGEEPAPENDAATPDLAPEDGSFAPVREEPAPEKEALSSSWKAFEARVMTARKRAASEDKTVVPAQEEVPAASDTKPYVAAGYASFLVSAREELASTKPARAPRDDSFASARKEPAPAMPDRAPEDERLTSASGEPTPEHDAQPSSNGFRPAAHLRMTPSQEPAHALRHTSTDTKEVEEADATAVAAELKARADAVQQAEAAAFAAELTARVDAVQQKWTPEVGARVEVEYDGGWYLCAISAVASDAQTCTVTYDEEDGGEEESDVKLALRIRRFCEPWLLKGMRVEVLKKDLEKKELLSGSQASLYKGIIARGNYLPQDERLYGRVLSVSADGRYCETVYEQDGRSVESDVHVASRVRPLPDTASAYLQSRTRLAGLEPQQQHRGTVTSVSKFGVFVDIGAEVDGLVHASRVSTEKVANIKDVVKVGQEVDVWVIGIDQNKLTLSMVDLLKEDIPASRLRSIAEIPSSEWLTGVAARVEPYGVFVDVDTPSGDMVQGLVPKAELRDAFIADIFKEVQAGEIVRVRVVSVDVADQRITLSMKADPTIGWKGEATDVNAFEAVEASVWLTGTVHQAALFGIFVDVEPPGGGELAEGFVHATQIRSGFVDDPATEVEIGQQVKVRILKVDKELGRLQLSMKE